VFLKINVGVVFPGSLIRKIAGPVGTVVFHNLIPNNYHLISHDCLTKKIPKSSDIVEYPEIPVSNRHGNLRILSEPLVPQYPDQGISREKPNFLLIFQRVPRQIDISSQSK